MNRYLKNMSRVIKILSRKKNIRYRYNGTLRYFPKQSVYLIEKYLAREISRYRPKQGFLK